MGEIVSDLIDTVSHNPHQNGVAERLNRTLMDLVRAMLRHSNVDKGLWAEALAAAVHIRNRVTTRALGSKTTPFDVMYGRKPSVGHLRVFGCRCGYKVNKDQSGNLTSRGRHDRSTQSWWPLGEATMIVYCGGSAGTGCGTWVRAKW